MADTKQQPCRHFWISLLKSDLGYVLEIPEDMLFISEQKLALESDEVGKEDGDPTFCRVLREITAQVITESSAGEYYENSSAYLIISLT